MALPHTNAPTLNAILDTDIPYLDVTLGEFIRLANIVPRIVRVSREDTEVLGIYIPKGAETMCTTFRLESVPDEESELNSMQSQPMTLRVPRQTFVQLTNLGSSVGE
ncbi:hypothetical protein E4U60_001031 [Claviceps pazoutovae]|uniref:Uncharacterized protein n=1 Tax=Claviceps pazoutovae TaxID=1649127 RepID=A0A9P7SI66_9HYPO|nr:hypothetical protein E4U60_001031 [Claviceps pazoutovae]